MESLEYSKGSFGKIFSSHILCLYALSKHWYNLYHKHFVERKGSCYRDELLSKIGDEVQELPGTE